MSLKEQLNLEKIPKHIAIIMDGNGRWAKARGLQRTAGHREGVESVRAITEEAARLGVKYLTVYAFSTENWNRPEAEVTTLMKLFIDALEEALFMKTNIRFRVIGQRDRLPQDVLEHLTNSEERTAGNTRMTLTLALSYSSRWELTDTMQKIAREVAAGSLKPEEVTEETITQHLNTFFMPDPDLLIRTGGELRMSNYLLWQCAYSELYFCNTYWPDFREEDFWRAILDFQHRERRFGKTSEQIAKQS
jgi:undecaprenyl diphosphate synthase